MAATAERTDPELWDKVKREITEGERGGNAGQWSARKAQLAVQEYKKRGGGYKGRKAPDNHLRQWTDEHWGTKSGEDSRATGERYLPERARDALTDKEYSETTAKKRADTKRGRQFSTQPEAIARKTAAARDGGSATTELEGLPRSDLLARAARAGIRGRSRMNKTALVQALA